MARASAVAPARRPFTLGVGSGDRAEVPFSSPQPFDTFGRNVKTAALAPGL